ncbi:MAG: shikimate kinase [Acidobacteriota bacterium]|nr:shikimate kinase [Acidobacteriota bacterium]
MTPAMQAEPTTQTPPLPLQHLQRITLTGFMGAGKTTIGRLLAERLGWNFLDLDAYLEQRTGNTIADIFAQHGEQRFRRLESAALVSALGLQHTVLALGGGTPEGLTNRLLLEQTPGTLTVFLDAPFSTLYDRCVLQDIARPVLANVEDAQQRFQQRRPHYLRLAGLTLNTADRTPEQTVQQLLAELSR